MKKLSDLHSTWKSSVLCRHSGLKWHQHVQHLVCPLVEIHKNKQQLLSAYLQEIGVFLKHSKANHISLSPPLFFSTDSTSHTFLRRQPEAMRKLSQHSLTVNMLCQLCVKVTAVQPKCYINSKGANKCYRDGCITCNLYSNWKQTPTHKVTKLFLSDQLSFYFLLCAAQPVIQRSSFATTTIISHISYLICMHWKLEHVLTCLFPAPLPYLVIFSLRQMQYGAICLYALHSDCRLQIFQGSRFGCAACRSLATQCRRCGNIAASITQLSKDSKDLFTPGNK